VSPARESGPAGREPEKAWAQPDGSEQAWAPPEEPDKAWTREDEPEQAWAQPDEPDGASPQAGAGDAQDRGSQAVDEPGAPRGSAGDDRRPSHHEAIHITVEHVAHAAAGEVPPSPAEPPPEERRRRLHHVLIVRLVFLALAGVGLYVVWPGLLQVFSAAPRLRTIEWVWFPLMATAVAASYVCVWVLYRIVLHVRSWLLVATSQLASAAFGRFVPGGAASTGALMFQMLVEGGVHGARVGTGIMAVNIISGGTVLALPLFSLPVLLGTVYADDTLRSIGFVGLGILGVLVGFVLLMLLVDRPLHYIGSVYAYIGGRLFKRRRPPEVDLSDVLLRERDLVRDVLGARWKAAVAAALGQRGFDFAALLLALYAVGADTHPLVVLLAYSVAQILILLPITPGGLGIVEVSLVGLLGIAGVPAGQALLATLAYRLFTYWMPLPTGAAAYVLFVHRFGRSNSANSAAARHGGEG
jgi:uncharacterized membrane protein YbhN (UPF0104 family)